MPAKHPRSAKPLIPRPDVVEVIDRAALVENMFNQVIVGYCRPPRGACEFMWSVVLDTSVMSLGAKVRVVLAVAQEMRIAVEKDALHSVISLRNAFAHHATHAHPVLEVPAKRGDKTVAYKELWVLGSSGKIRRLPRHEALADFTAQYEKARTSLTELIDAIHAKFEHDA
jgi:hypothetical protein